jgi:hypothetical protein
MTVLERPDDVKNAALAIGTSVFPKFTAPKNDV